MSDFAFADGPTTADEAVWWYRDGAHTAGPVSTAELRRLAEGPLAPGTMVWRKTFGEGWRRLDATLASEGRSALPPPVDYGRWTKVFAKFDAHPDEAQWSWLGLLGPIAYLFLGMRHRAWVLWSISFACKILLMLVDAPGSLAILPAGLLAVFGATHLKRDYYRHKVRGETMWRPVRPLANGYACGGLALVLFLAMVALRAGDLTDATPSSNDVGVSRMSTDGRRSMAAISGVWQSGGDQNVVLDLAGETKTIAFGGKTYTVRLSRGGVDDGVMVYADVEDPKFLITLQQNWDDKHESFALDLYIADELQGTFGYVRPI